MDKTLISGSGVMKQVEEMLLRMKSAGAWHEEEKKLLSKMTAASFLYVLSMHVGHTAAV